MKKTQTPHRGPTLHYSGRKAHRLRVGENQNGNDLLTLPTSSIDEKGPLYDEESSSQTGASFAFDEEGQLNARGLR